MSRLVALAVLVLCGICCPTGGAGAQQLVADLTRHLVAITTGFTGTSVTLFGAVDGGGDIVVTVRGPEREAVVRRKSRAAGIWLNKKTLGFAAVPGYYAVLASRPIEQAVPADLRQLHGIGLEALKLEPVHPASPGDVAAFRAALIENLVASGLYKSGTGQVEFLGDRLFRATLDFPATVPTGTYSVQIFLLQKGEIVAAQTTPLVIAQSGFEAEVNDFALDHAALYGAIAAGLAAMAGWGASLLFRSA